MTEFKKSDSNCTMKYIVVTGGVISGLGKGVVVGSIGTLLQSSNLDISIVKIDPYLNVDAGKLSPFEHGEVYVLDDGSETDLDFGTYERFLNNKSFRLTNANSITSGKVYKSVIDAEINGDYLGQTVQIVPHVTDKISEYLYKASLNSDICIIEIGGTVGDLESLPFVEAISRLKSNNEVCFVHVTLIPKIKNEFKTKPAQNSIKELKALGISPDIVIIRTNEEIDEQSKLKLRTESKVFTNIDVDTIYKVPILFHSQNIDKTICQKLNINCVAPNVDIFQNYVEYFHDDSLSTVTIGIVGKYTKMQDAYLSLIHALEHASFKMKSKLNITWISSEDLDKTEIVKCDGIIIPGGFGSRGIEGMIDICNYCRVQNIPLLGICLGLHVMCIEAVRNLCKLDANSEEFDVTTSHKIINIQNQKSMKLGLYKTYITDDATLAHKIYESKEIYARHRHRYEVNPDYIDILSSVLTCSGISHDYKSIDIIEDTSKSFYLGCQYHPEFTSSLHSPSPLFINFLLTCVDLKKN